MKKFFAALGALAIVSMIAMGCKGKDTPIEEKASISVKQDGKDITSLTLNIGEKVGISTNAASAEGAIIVVAKPAEFTVTSSDANVVAASKKEIEAKAEGKVKITFATGDAKVEVAVKVNKKGEGGEEIKAENYYGIKDKGTKKDIYVPSTLKFADMKKWQPIVTKAMSANGLDWTNLKLNDPSRAFGFIAPEGSKQHYFRGVIYTHTGDSNEFVPNVHVFSGYVPLSNKPADADKLINAIKEKGLIAQLAGSFGAFKAAKDLTVSENWETEEVNFGKGHATEYQAKSLSQIFLDSSRNIVLLYKWTVLKDMEGYDAKLKGIPALSEDLFLLENTNTQSSLKTLRKVMKGDFRTNYVTRLCK